MIKNKLIFLIFVFLQLSACSKVQINSSANAQLLEKQQYAYKKLARSPWPELKSPEAILPSQSSPLIPEVRKRLIALNDLQLYNMAQSKLYDDMLVNGIKRFQERHGLNADGVIGQSTLSSLNVNPNLRLQQIQKAMAEWNTLSSNQAEQEYIHVNIASYQLNIFKGYQNPLKMNVVVGNPRWPTPLLTSELKTIVVNPKWNIPRNITEKEIIHKIADNVNYLEEKNIKVIDGWHKGAKQIEPSTVPWQDYTGVEDLPFRLMQGAGEDNALGKVKFTFPNSEHVYLHDTPNKAAFKQTERNLSHGCVRLESPLALLNYLFESKHLGHKDIINKHIKNMDMTKHYALKKPIPIYITKINAWVDDKGLIHFKDDYPI